MLQRPHSEDYSAYDLIYSFCVSDDKNRRPGGGNLADKTFFHNIEAAAINAMKLDEQSSIKVFSVKE